MSRTGEIAYGYVYIWDFGGYVNALNATTGEIEWTYTRGSAGYNTPYGIYPLWYNAEVCDGKIFLSEGHMYDQPLSPGSRQLALNATTGELVWSILSFTGRVPAAHADGYMVQWNSYDNQIYTFGKGPTAITVTAAPKTSVNGDSILIEGMVTDQSPGTKNPDRIARFPNGVPAVSDESMSAWMEYVYMQQPKPTNATGVTMKLETLDPNGNFYDIGTATSDASGMYKLLWTPPVPGEYTIIATFPGSESYYSSSAETALGVTEAPSATPGPTPPPAPMTDTIVIGTGIGVIIAVAIVGAVIALIFRKR
jgi:hypothetical protein